MKIRRFPFGYRMEMGELILHKAEANLVRWIFEQYCARMTYNGLVDKLKDQSILYDEGKVWNKNMVARVLEDGRYIGEKGYPAIVDAEIFNTVQKIRNAKKTPSKTTETKKILRQLSGRRCTERMEAQTLIILNNLIAKPIQIQCPLPSMSSNDSDLVAELNEALAAFPIDGERAKALVFQTAAESYKAIGAAEYETHRLRCIAEQTGRMQILDAAVLRSMVDTIATDQSGVSSLRLKNGQVVIGVNEYGNSNP